MEPVDHMKPSTVEDTSRASRTRKKAGAKAPASEAGKRSLNLRIDEDSYQRLNVHALMRNKTVSELVMEFAQTQLREYVVHRRSVAGEG